MNVDLAGIGMTSQRTRKRLVRQLMDEGITDKSVLQALETVPRHMFVDEALASRAYENTALPIGHGQTISQPYIVAKMTQALLGGERMDSVLEIGTGCGYQTMVLSGLVEKVYTIERIGALYRKARERLHDLKVNNVRFRLGDGNLGWQENAPFDGILVTAAPPSLPLELTRQLKPGGRMVIPVGADKAQRLMLLKEVNGQFEETLLELVSFVPMLCGKR